MRAKAKKSTMHFNSTARTNVPQGRNGKHKKIVSQILADLAQIATGTALKLPLADLSDTKEKVRSALNRATRKTGRKVATSSDDDFLYIWNEA
jgi:hypothetical protein